MALSHLNKYFTASFDNYFFDDESGSYSEIVFLRDIGPFKAGDTYPEGYVSLEVTEQKVYLVINMYTGKKRGKRNLVHKIDVFNFV